MNTLLMIDAENIGWKHFECWAMRNSASVFSAEIRRAYGDFSNPILAPWCTTCVKYGISLVTTTHARKNQTDMHLSTDAMELLYEKNPSRLILMSGDADYVPMLTKFRARGVAITIVAQDGHSMALSSVVGRVDLMEDTSPARTALPVDMPADQVIRLVLHEAIYPIFVATLVNRCREVQPSFEPKSLRKPILQYLQENKEYSVWLLPDRGPTAWMVRARGANHG